MSAPTAKSTSPNENGSGPRRVYRELGWAGLQSWDGRDPRETDGIRLPAALQGAEWRRTLVTMAERDAVIHGVLLAIDTLVRQVKWKVLPNKEKPNEDYRLFFEQCIGDMSISLGDTLSEILSFLTFGFSWHEIVYGRRMFSEGSKYDDGLDRWTKFAIRGQTTLDRWEFDANGGVQAFWQYQEDYSSKRIPIDRSLLFRTRSRLNNPEGPSLLTGAYEQWRMKWHVMRVEGIGIERELAGIPIAWGPPEMWDESNEHYAKFLNLRNHLTELVSQIKVDENRGIVFPLMYQEGTSNKIYDITLMRSGGTRQIDTDKVIDRYDHRILTSMLADWLLLGQNTVGSFALASTKTDLFAVALGTFVGHIAEMINAHGIPRLMKRNGMDRSQAPYLEPGDIEGVDLGQLASFIDMLTKAGAAMTDSQIRWLMAQGGLPAPEEGEKVTVRELNEIAAEKLAARQPTIGNANPKNDDAGGAPAAGAG